jgi:RNA polymerase sigma factor (sigma-70 family)
MQEATMSVHSGATSGDVQLSAIDARYRRALISFFLRRVRDASEAEDLTQQALLRLMGSVHRGEVENIEPFLFTIAANLVRDHHRRAMRRSVDTTVSVDESLIDALTEELVEDRSPERVLIGRQTVADVLRALDELGERTRDIFILFRLENMKQRDIAALYGISQSTVEKHVARAVLHLATRNRAD